MSAPVEHEDHCGDVDCPRCADLVPRRRGASVVHAGTQPRRQAERLSPLSPEELTALRAQVPCHGCGAVRRDRPGAQRAPFSYIRHGKGCPVRTTELAEARRVALARGRSAAAARRRSLDGPDPGRPGPPAQQSPASAHQQDHATVTVPDAGRSLDAEGVAVMVRSLLEQHR